MLLDAVQEALGKWPKPRPSGNRVVVPTQCLTAGGDIVHVVVEGGVNSFKVHDDGAALRIFENSGGELRNVMRIIQSASRSSGLIADSEGVISSDLVSLEELPSVIVLVANAVREVADHLIDRWKPEFKKKFKDAVRDLLEHEFPKRWDHDKTVVGHSNKPQKFDFAVELKNQKTLFFDAVVPDQNSISAAVVRHLDVQQAHNDDVVQRIIYDDRVPWRAADINLLKMGAPALAFSQALAGIERIAA